MKISSVVGTTDRQGQFISSLSGKSFSSNEEGSAIIEMAVTLPLIMLIMTGIFSFSLALYQKLQLAEAVSNAGHYLAVARGDHDPCATATAAIQNAAPGLTSKSLTITIILNGTTETSSSCPGAGTTGANTDLASGKTAQIKVTYPTALNVYGRSFAGFNLQSQVTEVVQ